MWGLPYVAGLPSPLLELYPLLHGRQSVPDPLVLASLRTAYVSAVPSLYSLPLLRLLVASQHQLRASNLVLSLSHTLTHTHTHTHTHARTHARTHTLSDRRAGNIIWRTRPNQHGRSPGSARTANATRCLPAVRSVSAWRVRVRCAASRHAFSSVQACLEDTATERTEKSPPTLAPVRFRWALYASRLYVSLHSPTRRTCVLCCAMEWTVVAVSSSSLSLSLSLSLFLHSFPSPLRISRYFEVLHTQHNTSRTGGGKRDTCLALRSKRPIRTAGTDHRAPPVGRHVQPSLKRATLAHSNMIATYRTVTNH